MNVKNNHSEISQNQTIYAADFIVYFTGQWYSITLQMFSEPYLKGTVYSIVTFINVYNYPVSL
jgi:hypothetical protein